MRANMKNMDFSPSFSVDIAPHQDVHKGIKGLQNKIHNWNKLFRNKYVFTIYNMIPFAQIWQCNLSERKIVENWDVTHFKGLWSFM